MISKIEGNDFNDENAQNIGLSLKKNKTLKALHLCIFLVHLIKKAINSILFEVSQAISEGLLENNTLIFLNLGIILQKTKKGMSKLNTNGAMIIFNALKNNKSLVTLSLSFV